jgi:hypothetical protein
MNAMGEVITSILTNSSARSAAAVTQTLMQKADNAKAWFAKETG